MLSSVRAVDTVARVGGDEFVVVCEGMDDTHADPTFKDKLVAAIATVRVGPGQTVVTASIGVACAAARGETAEDLLRRADLAMYAVKIGRRSRSAIRRGPEDRDTPPSGSWPASDLQM